MKREQGKWNKLTTIYHTLIDKLREAILLHMTMDYVYKYSTNIIGKEKVEINSHTKETLEAMGKSDLKKLFITKVDTLKKEKELEKSAIIISQIPAVAMALDNIIKGDVDEFEFLVQIFVANLSSAQRV